MERRMIINSLYAEECRIAITEGERLVELEIESGSLKKLKGNIYKGVISRIEPSLQAAFVDFGTNKNGFLQINDIHPSYFKSEVGGNRKVSEFNTEKKPIPEKSASLKPPLRPSSPNRRSQISIRDLLVPGQELVVQVVKEERDMKGATLTTYLSLPGRYVVLMPGSERGGISRKINDTEQRKRLKQLTQDFELPSGVGVIIRTAGLDRSQTDLSRDLSLQLKLWERLLKDSIQTSGPTLLYKESDLATRVVRDYFSPDIREIIVDKEETYNQVKQFVGQVMPRYRSRVKLFDKFEPIFSHFKIEDEVNQTYHRTVQLPSGGAIVFDPLEALVAVDVNSGKSTGQENIEETAFQTNIEATREIARQLRLRDLGGLIVVDYIDMSDPKHRAAVEREIRTAVKEDKARIEVGQLSKFGLLEMSRQRLRASLSSQSHSKCSSCHGLGIMKNPDLVALEALRKVHGAAATGEVSSIRIRLPAHSALFLLNVKKKEIVELEERFGATVTIIADGRLKGDDYEFEIESRKAIEVQVAAIAIDESQAIIRSKSVRDQGLIRRRRRGRTRKGPRKIEGEDTKVA
jgi:ribonuclease E